MLKAFTIKRTVLLNEREENDFYIKRPVDQRQARHASSLSQNEMDANSKRKFRHL